MQPYQSFSRRLGGVLLVVLAAASLLGARPARAAIVVATASFDADAAGWTALACPNPGLCALGSAPIAIEHLAVGGNPAGYIRSRDPSSSTAGRFAPPAAFSNLLAVGQTLSFDVLVERNGGDGVYDSTSAPLVAIETAGGTLVFATADLPTIDGDWRRYDVPLFESDGWLLASASLRPLAPGEFDSLFATRTRLTIIAEWLNDSADLDTGGLDNVTLSAVPLPGTLPLLMTGALAIAGTALRRHHRR